MTEYNPFTRGSLPVGTRRYIWTDIARDHTMPVDVWYPATEAHRGQDMDTATMDTYEMVPGMGKTSQHAVKDAEALSGKYPLVVFSHGFGGERRQSTFFCTHLASHGYVVAAMDHVGNTTVDMISGASGAGDPTVIDQFIASRPQDASFVISQMLDGASGHTVLPDQVGMSGHSFGGWTTLRTLETDTRIKAALPLAPAGGFTRVDPDNVMATTLSFQWGREVPTLYLVSDLDSILPLEGMRDLYHRNPEPRTSVVLNNADHFHFNDDIEQAHDGFKMIMTMMSANMEGEARKSLDAMLSAMKPASELVAGKKAYDLINGLGLAHFDAHLRGNASARALLSDDLVALLAERGTVIELMN